MKCEFKRKCVSFLLFGVSICGIAGAGGRGLLLVERSWQAVVGKGQGMLL